MKLEDLIEIQERRVKRMLELEDYFWSKERTEEIAESVGDNVRPGACVDRAFTAAVGAQINLLASLIQARDRDWRLKSAEARWINDKRTNPCPGA